MNAILGIGAGAGLVSALLFVAIATGRLIALPLFFVAPLPIILAALGWNHRAGLAAAVAGALLIGLVASPLSGFMFLISVGLPAWWTAYLLLLARSDGGTVEWYPLGRLLVWIAASSAALTLLGAVLLGDGDYATFVANFERAAALLDHLNPGIFDGMPQVQADADAASLGRLFAVVAPPISAALGVLGSTVLLYGGARIVRASGRFPRPWTAVSEARLPQMAAAALAVSVVLGVVLTGFPALAMRSTAASLAMAFCLQGLAVIHVLTVGVSGRIGILTGVYATLVLFLVPGWPVVLYGLLGLVDAFTDLRGRKQGRGPPPLPPPLK